MLEPSNTTRRNFLKSVAISAALPLVSGPRSRVEAASASSVPAWQTAVGLDGFQSGTHKYRMTYPIWEVLDFAERTGFDGIELVSDWPMGGYPGAEETERIQALRRLKAIYDPNHFDWMDGSTGRPHELLERVGVSNIGYLHLTDTDGTLRDGGTSKHLACGDGHASIVSPSGSIYSPGQDSARSALSR